MQLLLVLRGSKMTGLGQPEGNSPFIFNSHWEMQKPQLWILSASPTYSQ